MRRAQFNILPLLLILLPVLAQAGSFGRPSNPAGVWEMTIQPGTQLISFPMLPPESSPNAVLGDRFPGGLTWETAARILTYEDGELLGSFYNSLTDAWEGNLDTLKLERAYWVLVPLDADAVTLRLVGGAITMEQTTLDIIEPGVHAVACPAIVPVTLGGSGLIESGWVSDEYRVRADRIYSLPDADGVLQMSWHDPQQGWVGHPFTFEPGRGYLLERLAGRSAIPWTRPALTVGEDPPEPIRVDPGQQPQLLSLPFDADTPPWQIDTGSDDETPAPTRRRTGR